MLFLFLYFLLLLLVILPIGWLTARLVGILKVALIDKLWLGFGMITVLASVWSFFSSLGGLFFLILVVMSGISIWKFRSDLEQMLKKSLNQYYSLSSLITGIFIALIVLAAGSLSGYVLDNDSYYIQTIQWLDTYGLVPGIANWHFFLAQQSGFHILESALNMEFLGMEFNDVGLFMTLTMMCWSVLPSSKEELPAQKAFRNLLALIFPIVLLLGTAPSPDVPVILLHYYVVYKFLFGDTSKQNLWMLTALVALCCYFKITSIFLGVFPMLLFMEWKSRENSWILKTGGVVLTFAALFLIKNSIASGYPLFPLTLLSLDVDWLMPIDMATFYSDATVAQAYGLNINGLQSLNAWDRFLVWIQQAGMEGFINKAVAFITLTSVLLIFISKDKRVKVVVIAFLLYVIALIFSSPQARFLLPFLFPIFVLLLLYGLSSLRNHSLTMSRIGIACGLLVLVAPSLIAQVTDNERMRTVPQFEISNVLKPSHKSRFNSAFAKAKINNINYQDPQADDFFYGTYDIPLPAAQQEYLLYFKRYYLISPEYRGDVPKDGFRALRD